MRKRTRKVMPRPGHHLMVCDISGFTGWDDEMRQMWDGRWVLKEYWEPRHPQDFVKGRPELPTIGHARNRSGGGGEGDDDFVEIGEDRYYIYVDDAPDDEGFYSWKDDDWTEDKQGNYNTANAMKAVLTADSFSNTASRKVPLNFTDFDPNWKQPLRRFDTLNHNWQCPEDGRYLFMGSIRTTMQGGNTQGGIRVGGGNYYNGECWQFEYVSYGQTYRHMKGMKMYQLTEGQIVNLWIAGGGPSTVYQNGTWLFAVKIGD